MYINQMNKARTAFTALFIGATTLSTPAFADISRIESYLTSDEGERVAADIGQLKSQIRDFNRYSKLSETVGSCPRTSEPLQSETYLLLASENKTDNAQFYKEYGEYLGLPMPFDPLNRYHKTVMFHRVNSQNEDYNLTTRSDLTDDQITSIANAFLQKIIQLNQKMHEDFWPHELINERGSIDREFLNEMQWRGYDVVQQSVSDILLERAKLTAEMLRDEIEVCDASAQQDWDATLRAKIYYSPFGLRESEGQQQFPSRPKTTSPKSGPT
jgi:hypothetical protein